MTPEDVTVEDLKRMALHQGPMAHLEMMLEGDPLVVHLGLTAQLYKHSRELRQLAKHLRSVSDSPEHVELAKAMLDAARGARVAFDAAANAAWQLYWISNHCECEECVNERRQQQAPNN